VLSLQLCCGDGWTISPVTAMDWIDCRACA